MRVTVDETDNARRITRPAAALDAQPANPLLIVGFAGYASPQVLAEVGKLRNVRTLSTTPRRSNARMGQLLDDLSAAPSGDGARASRPSTTTVKDLAQTRRARPSRPRALVSTARPSARSISGTRAPQEGRRGLGESGRSSRIRSASPAPPARGTSSTTLGHHVQAAEADRLHASTCRSPGRPGLRLGIASRGQ
jgi:hypothetical protein